MKIVVILMMSSATVLLLAAHSSTAFHPSPKTLNRYRVALEMGKGLNRARNKQAALAKKMELARQQKEGTSTPQEELSEKSIQSLSDAEIQKRNDQLRFEQLLKTESANVLNNYSKDGYLTKEQEEEEINAARAGVDRLFEGDPAPREPFEALLSIQTSNAVGPSGAKQLVPNAGDYLVVLTDPRIKSEELRHTIKSLNVDLPAEIRKKLIVINADSPAENRR